MQLKKVVLDKYGFTLKEYSKRKKLDYRRMRNASSGFSLELSTAYQLFKDGFGEAVEKTFPKRKFTFENEILTVETITKRGDIQIRQYPPRNHKD
jgi:hypothetical protein